jgi:hypothetical protein
MTTPTLESRPAWVVRSQLNSWMIPTLAILLLLLSLVSSGMAFMYPLEIETRESAVWLHVLAIKAGIHIYDPAQVAFIKMHKGPFDPAFKFAISTLLPMLEGWQVTRLAVFWLPYLFLGITWKLIAKTALSAWHILYLGCTGYAFVLLCGKEFILAGREDATVALFFLVLIYLSISYTPKSYWSATVCGLLWGLVGMAIVLTNWRIAPIVVGSFIFTVWRHWQIQLVPKRYLISYAIACIFSALLLWATILSFFFDFDLTYYWKLHFGFFSEESGWGTDRYYGSVFSFVRSLFNPYVADPSNLKGGPLLLTLIVYGLVPKRINPEHFGWLAWGLWSLVITAVSYYLNHNGGGQWYFVPFVIILWFFVAAHYVQISQPRLVALGVVVLFLLAINYRTVLLPTVNRLLTLDQANQFLTTARSLQKNHTVLSEDTFFYRTAYQGELIDSGDEVEAVTATHYYGPVFTQTAQRHFDRTRNHPPDYILTGITQSSQLDTLIKEQYVLLKTGPMNLSGNGFERSRLFQRRDQQ